MVWKAIVELLLCMQYILLAESHVYNADSITNIHTTDTVPYRAHWITVLAVTLVLLIKYNNMLGISQQIVCRDC